MKIRTNILVVCIASCQFSSCEKFLEAKSDGTLAVPSTLADMQGILDNYSVMNNVSDIMNNMTDEYYLRKSDWEAEAQMNNESYVWHPETGYISEDNDWNRLYKIIFYANSVLDNLQNVNGSQTRLNEIKGAALFFRAVIFYQLTHLYTPPYLSVSPENKLGIVIRLSADFNQPIQRSSVQETYQQIVRDLEEAAKLLPDNAPYKTRPSKAAAYGYLAKVFLDMQDFDKVKDYSNAALAIYDTLVDFNQVVPAFNPFERFFPETIFYLNAINSLNSFDWIAMVDSSLYKSYEADDLRKLLYFQDAQGNGTVAFEGSYTGAAYPLFNGLATDELYLLRAEANARLNNIEVAMADLNLLLSKRYVAGTLEPRVANTREEALHQILLERRKELLNRGTRWPDLRRLSQEPAYAITPKRILGDDIYSLPPGDPRYALMIPAKVIQMSELNQNPR